MSIYESVLELREKRLEMEEALQDIQKAVDELKKTHTRLLASERSIDKEQKQTEAEIQSFQSEKLRKLNQVDISFTLRVSQVQAMQAIQEDAAEAAEGAAAAAPAAPGAPGAPGAAGAAGAGGASGPVPALQLPKCLDDQVVFTTAGLQRLMSRITELHQEKALVAQNYRQLKRSFVVRNKEKKVAERKIEELQRKFEDIQLLKFGQVIDLDLVERSSSNKLVQELTGKVEEVEKSCRSQLEQIHREIAGAKTKLSQVTKENTSLMEQIVQMGYSQLALDQALNARIANVTVNDAEPTNELKDVEKERMKDLLTLQAKEIATLQAEIALFRQKGGHIYTTVTANRLEGQ